MTQTFLLNDCLYSLIIWLLVPGKTRLIHDLVSHITLMPVVWHWQKWCTAQVAAYDGVGESMW